MKPPTAQQFLERTPEAQDFLREARLEVYRRDAHKLARSVGVTTSTIYAFRSGRTVWPRHTTLFPLLEALGYELRLVKRGRNDWRNE